MAQIPTLVFVTLGCNRVGARQARSHQHMLSCVPNYFATVVSVEDPFLCLKFEDFAALGCSRDASLLTDPVRLLFGRVLVGHGQWLLHDPRSHFLKLGSEPLRPTSASAVLCRPVVVTSWTIIIAVHGLNISIIILK